jgi:hypothetical protein
MRETKNRPDLQEVRTVCEGMRGDRGPCFPRFAFLVRFRITRTSDQFSMTRMFIQIPER